MHFYHGLEGRLLPRIIANSGTLAMVNAGYMNAHDGEVGRDVHAPDVDISFDGIDLYILELMGCGLPDAAIARKLALSHRTVQRRVRRMMERTSAVSRFAFGFRVSELGLIRAQS